MKTSFTIIFSAVLILFSGAAASASEDEDSSLTIKYDGYKEISGGVILLDISFIQPNNGNAFTLFSELTISVKLKGSTQTATVNMIDNETESYSPYIAISAPDADLISISVLGMLCSPAEPDEILNIDTTIFRKVNSSTYQSGVRINQKGNCTDFFSEYPKQHFFNRKIHEHPFSFYSEMLEIQIIAVLSFFILTYFFIRFFIAAQFRQNTILEKMPVVFNKPDEKNSRRAIRLLYAERLNIRFIFLFRNKFMQNFNIYENAILTSREISNDTRDRLLFLLYYYMLKPFKPVE